ncbi:hypothetical protein [Hyphomicrobium sp.]|uniref:hypothetical protein n=1 Tax=Hyphomicrobium sp. TaxID=82 RepID=UPI000F99338E|nr:hypothetical protein [Hyphomicrobium sp.]RUP10581.1 MAG: hypothetical protein EKK38_03405 [Hyphomicrobium sp.]
MTVTEVALSMIGAFYAFGGWVATRAGLASLFMDKAIASISGQKPNASEMAQSYWLIAAANLILAGGVALLIRMNVAMWLFLASAVGQAFYLYYLAPRIFDREDPPDAVGRAQTRNAFVLYLAATAFVVWAASRGALLGWQDVPSPILAVAGAAVVARFGYVIWMTVGPGSLRTKVSGSPPAWIDDNGSAALESDPSQSRSVKVIADYHCHPLWAMDEHLYGDFPPEQLGLSPELSADLNAWADAFTSSLNEDDPSKSLWTDDQHRTHRAEARPLALRLAQERPDLKIYVTDVDGYVVEVGTDPVEGA